MYTSTCKCNVYNGTRQGGLLSPFLFNIFHQEGEECTRTMVNWAHVVENIVNCQVLYFYMERRNGKGSKHDFVTWCRICAAFDCARY